LVGEIPGPEDPNVASWQVHVADDLAVVGVQHRPVPWGGDPAGGNEEGIQVWQVTDPEAPQLLSTFHYGAGGTHRNLYTGGRYIHATPELTGTEGYIYSILDIDDPRQPREVGRWFLPEQ